MKKDKKIEEVEINDAKIEEVEAETEEVEAKDGFFTKIKCGAKKHGPKAAKAVIGAVAIGGAFILGKILGGKGDEDEDYDTDDYVECDDNDSSNDEETYE